MRKKFVKEAVGRIRRWYIDRVTQHDERHGILLTMYIEAAPLDPRELWPRLHAALDLIATHTPVWLSRMHRVGNSVHVRRIPGTRAMLKNNRFTILDPYLLANFLPAQLAASIVHEATHALLAYRKADYDPANPARHERICRRAELRFGKALRAAGVNGADAVIERAAGSLAASDAEVGVVVDWAEWRVTGAVTRINELRVPRWFKRLLARRAQVLDTPQGRAAFGDNHRAEKTLKADTIPEE